MKGNREMANLLLPYIFENVESTSEYSIPLLHLPIYNDDDSMLDTLLLAGLNCNTRDANSYTPLMIAAKYGLDKCAKRLIDYGKLLQTSYYFLRKRT